MNTDIPAVAAHPTAYGRQICCLGPCVGEAVLIGYGDDGTDPGPVDLIAVHPDGTVDTLYEGFDSNQIISARVFADGSIWVPGVDAYTSPDVAQLLTNRGGPWHQVEVSIPGTSTHHAWDAAETSDSSIRVRGSRPSTAHGYNNGAAMTLESTDGGTTWAEVESFEGDGLSAHYGFGFVQLGDVLVVASGQERYVDPDGVWHDTAPALGYISSHSSFPDIDGGVFANLSGTSPMHGTWTGTEPSFTAYSPGGVAFAKVLAQRPDGAVVGVVWHAASERWTLYDTAAGYLAFVPETFAHEWSGDEDIWPTAAVTSTGALWITDATTLYRVPPPD